MLWSKYRKRLKSAILSGAKNVPLIGIELECFPLLTNGEIPQYEGHKGLKWLLLEFCHAGMASVDWCANVITAKCKATDCQITLEDGGAIEISTPPQSCTSNAIDRLTITHGLLATFLYRHGVRLLNIDHLTPHQCKDLSWIPGERPLKLRESFGQKFSGQQWNYAVSRTASLQISIDFCDENDLIEKTRLCNYLTPFFIFISSSLQNDWRTKGFKSRSFCWLSLDEKRFGVVEPFANPGGSLDDFVDWAADFQTLIRKTNDGLWKVENRRFSELMCSGKIQAESIDSEWIEHLSQIYTTTRIRHHLEFRPINSLPIRFIHGLVGLFIGLIYSDKHRHSALELFDFVSASELIIAHQDFARYGFTEQIGKLKTKRLFLKLLRLGLQGVAERHQECAELQDTLCEVTKITKCFDRDLAN